MKTLKIDGFLGHKSYTIDISERCLILIGENGSGKSTILKMIKALSELNFIELSKYRFNSLEYSDGSSTFKLELSDIMPNGEVENDQETIDQPEIIPNDDSNTPPSFDEEFYRHFISACRKQITQNQFAWILSCVFHGKAIDKSDMQRLENAKKYAFEKSAFFSMLENSYTWIDQIDVIKILKGEVKATEFSSAAYGIFSRLDFDIQLFEKSKLYYGKFDLQMKLDLPDINEDEIDYFEQDILNKALPNERYIEIVKKIKCIKSLLSLGNCLLVDMTSQFDLVNIPYQKPSSNDNPLLDYLRYMDTYASRLGVGALSPDGGELSDEIRKLHISVYNKYIMYLSRYYKKDSDNTGRYAELPHKYIPLLEKEEPFFNRFVENRQVNVSELIGKTFYNPSTIIEINVVLFRKYVKNLKENNIYTIDEKHELFDTLSSFFFDKYDELKDWFKPIIVRNSVFDFDYDKLRSTSKEIINIRSDWDERLIEIFGEDNSYLSASDSPFSFIHVLFYDFYNNEFKKYQKKHTLLVDKFTKVLSKFLFTKQISVSPAGVRILNQSGVEIEPKLLSSGERKVLILVLISMFIKDVTLLLDEPEISISVIWQSMLLPTLLSETKIDRIMVATQSPFIIEDEGMLKYLQALS